MARYREIKGVLHNFLGTYTSRYSDLDGYWLFGFLIEDISDLRIDLIEANSELDETIPFATARQIAVRKFGEQMDKAGISMSYIRDAYLNITKSPDTVLGYVNGRVSSGYKVRFDAKAVITAGKVISSTLTVFVAPHNPEIERRSERSQ